MTIGKLFRWEQISAPKSKGSLVLAANISVDPLFEARKDNLLTTAKSTCFIGVNPGPGGVGPISGTAFFVSSTTLITAGHMAPDRNRTIVAQYPGTQKAELFVEELFNNNPGVETFECEFVATGLPNADISILKVNGTFKAPYHVNVAQTTLIHDDRVDVIGYPGYYTGRYVRRMHTGHVDRNAITAVEELFPKCELVVSHGSVDFGGNMPTYFLSTVVGMSGSPVIKSGQVVGI